jgi:hypothetical protein
MGLQTVTWLIEGEVLHRDSLGSEQLITKGQLNLMTTGHGVSHAEETTGNYQGTVQGIQLWIAQPDSTRNARPDFAHHPQLPQFGLSGGVATVLIGELEDMKSAARYDTPLVGIDLELHHRSTVALTTSFEYGLIVLEGMIEINAVALVPGQLAYLGLGHDHVTIDVGGTTRAILLGGEPFMEPIQMWWNFVGRSQGEFDEAYSSWRDQDGRFGAVASTLQRIEGAAPYWRHTPK